MGLRPYDLDEIVNEYVRRANGRCNTEVIRSFVYNSGEMMDNLASLIPDTSDVFDYEGGQCIVQIAYDKPSGADYPVEVSGYKMWASTVQTVGTKNEQPVGKKQKTGISRLVRNRGILPRRGRGSGRRMVLRADRGALRAGCRRRC